MNLLTKYNEAEAAIHEHIGYESDWKIYPIDDCSDYYWYLDRTTMVYFADTLPALKNALIEEGLLDEKEFDAKCSISYYGNEIVRDGVYRGKELTGVQVDTHTDGNCFLSIFSNKKQLLFK